jgi:hypothetical protein
MAETRAEKAAWLFLLARCQRGKLLEVGSTEKRK